MSTSDAGTELPTRLATRPAARLLLAALGVVVVAGVVAFVRAAPACEVQLPRLAEHPAARHDLVDFRYGPLLRASSSALAQHHHPVFLVDGLASPSPLEKWASDSNDPRPWLELRWGSPRTVEEVALVLAGDYEGARNNEPSYTLRCLEAAGELTVTGNTAPRPRHPLACSGATGLRIEFPPVQKAPRDIVRVYEVEVLGR